MVLITRWSYKRGGHKAGFHRLPFTCITTSKPPQAVYKIFTSVKTTELGHAGTPHRHKSNTNSHKLMALYM